MNNTVLTDSAYASILEMILTKEIQAGERIREDLLAEKFKVSRTPVREAVNRLTQDGFILNEKRKGLYCVEITKEELLNLLDLRVVLESLSIRKCTAQATDEDIDTMRKLVSDFRYRYHYILANSDSPAKEIARLHNFEDVKFHVQIAKVSRSERLVKYTSEIETTLLLARRHIHETPESEKIILLSWEQHEQMIDAIKAKDEAGAFEVFENHLKLMKSTQVDIYE